MKIQKDVEGLLSSLPVAPPEEGGIIGGRNGVITRFYHDSGTGSRDEFSYEPDVDTLNEVISDWFAEGIDFYGIIHTHPYGQDSLSGGDREYILKIMSGSENGKRLYFPIVTGGRIIPFVAVKKECSAEISEEPLEII